MACRSDRRSKTRRENSDTGGVSYAKKTRVIVRLEAFLTRKYRVCVSPLDKHCFWFMFVGIDDLGRSCGSYRTRQGSVEWSSRRGWPVEATGGRKLEGCREIIGGIFYATMLHWGISRNHTLLRYEQNTCKQKSCKFESTRYERARWLFMGHGAWHTIVLVIRP